MRTIDLASLEIFRAVVEQGGIVRAAQALNRVQSNVTTRIKQLEQRLGTPLFRKQGRSLVLSREGELLWTYSQRLFRLADEAEQALRAGTPQGLLKIGALESTAASRLPPLLSRFHREHPGVVVELATGTTGSLLRRVSRYELEAAFVSQPYEAPGLQSTKAFEEELVLITARGVPPVRRAGDLQGMTMIAFSDGCSYRRRLHEWLAADGAAPARVLDFGSYHAIVACVAAGTGFALVPVSLLRTVRAAAVLRHPVPARIGRSETHLVWNGATSPCLQQLRQMLVPEHRAAR